MERRQRYYGYAIRVHDAGALAWIPPGGNRDLSPSDPASPCTAAVSGFASHPSMDRLIVQGARLG
jgi:hypothetical protein